MFTKKMGVGAFNLVKRSVYDEIGGYEAVALKVSDDMSFGALIVDKGYKQGFGLSGKGFITVKWYRNIFGLVKGIEKNSFGALNYSITVALGFCLYSLLTNIYPFVGIFFGPLWARALCSISILSLFAVYTYFAKHENTSSSYVLFYPIVALLYIAAILNSMVKTLSKGGVEWRGTFYSLKELKKNI